MAIADLLIVLLFVAFYTAIFLAGVGRGLLVLVASFVVLAAAALFVAPLATVFWGIVPGMSRWTSELVALVLVVSAIVVLGVLGNVWSWRLAPVATRRWFGSVGGPASLVLRSVVALLVTSVVLATVVNIISNTIDQLPADRVGIRLRREVVRSRLIPLARDAQRSIEWVALDWLPGDPPTILKGSWEHDGQ